ncbi:MAG: 6,7-dimethyl-8-ribityllumazine synthase, partial [Parvibaculales bacterium]
MSKKVLIVEARFYEDMADALAEGAIAALDAAGITHERVAVPGVLEVPVAIKYA